MVCLGVFAIIVATDYFIQRNIHQSVAQAVPSLPNVPSQSPTPTPKITPTSTPKSTPKQPDDDEKYISEEPLTPKGSTLAPVPTPDLQNSPYYRSPAGQDTEAGTTPRPTPRTELVVSASDVLSGGSKGEDTRRYHFHLDSIARVKGRFSAHGNISVQIVAAGIDPRYSSNGEVSADTIDVSLYPGTYELVVRAGSIVSFSVSLAAYYNL